MMNYLKKGIGAWALISAFLLNPAEAQTFYDVSTIQKIEIGFAQPDWDYQMDTAKNGAEGFIMAKWVKINGAQYDSVGVKYKGNSSYDSTSLKNPLHIDMDEYINNQNHQGYTDIKLSNCYADPSMIREVLSYLILENYMDCPLSNFVQLYINGAYIGLYSSDEAIDKKFCAKRFSSAKSTRIKCNPVISPGPATKSNLKYISADSSEYANFYEIMSDHGWNDLVSLCNTITNDASNIDSVMDMDRVLWMLAFNCALVNLDSYSGAFAQNYYLYKDNNNRYIPIVWDLNMSFGGFPYIGSSNTSMGSLAVTELEHLSPTVHSSDAYWPLIKDVMNNASYRKAYFAHLRTIVNEMFVNNEYKTSATALQSIIDTAAQSDPNKFYTYSQFQNGLTGNCTFGSYIVPGISNLIDERVEYLQSNSEYAYTAPTITSVTASDLAPGINTTVTITAEVTNASSDAIFLGYRSNKLEKFTKVLMYDDSNHNDGAANDNVYGASFEMVTAQEQYYVYAANDNAGIFSPERAEHEFYTLPNTTTSVSGKSLENLIVYPNPASNTLNICNYNTNALQTIFLQTLYGTCVYQGIFSESTTINVTNYLSGIYFVVVNGTTHIKIVITH
jgi:hypothetical protein